MGAVLPSSRPWVEGGWGRGVVGGPDGLGSSLAPRALFRFLFGVPFSGPKKQPKKCPPTVGGHFLAPFWVTFLVPILGTDGGPKKGPRTSRRSCVACVVVSGRGQHEEGKVERPLPQM
jgi:hypothetical protein